MTPLLAVGAGGGDTLVALGGAFLAAAALARVGRRIGLPTIPFFMAAGVLFGPHTPGFVLVAQPDDLDVFARLADPETRVILGMVVVEDIFIALYLALLQPVLHGSSGAGDAVLDVLRALVFLLALAFVARWGSGVVGRVIAVPHEELLTVSFLGLAVLVAGLAAKAGVSEAIGAFMAGAMLATSDVSRRVERLVLPLRDAFGAVLFFAFGLSVDPGDVGTVLWPVAAAVAFSVVANVVVGQAAAPLGRPDGDHDPLDPGDAGDGGDGGDAGDVGGTVSLHLTCGWGTPMDFSWTDEQDALYEQAREYANTRVNPHVAERIGPTFGRDDWKLLGELGLVGSSVPREYGGGGHDAQTTARAVEGFARACDDPGLVFGASAHLFACAMPIVEHADEQLKRRYLPGMASGELIGANAITEPEAGSDVFSLQATAVRDGDGYRINGVKSFVTNAPVADVFLVYASTEPAYGYMGITCFVVDRHSPGLRVGEHFDKIGLKTTPVAAVHFADCFVPEANRVGVDGQGAGIFSGSMGWERACLFAQYLGLMDRQLDEVVAYVKGRRQFGKSLSKFQAVTHRVADMKLRLEGARLLLYRACWMKDQGLDATMEIALSKVAVSEAAVQSGVDAIQLFGGAGVKADGPVESMLRDAIPSTIFSGTSEIQRDLIARGVGL